MEVIGIKLIKGEFRFCFLSWFCKYLEGVYRDFSKVYKDVCGRERMVRNWGRV